jgi:carbon monoxide dehydrogenase subunit G
MKLEQSFTVAAPVEQVWDMLVDVERVAPCLPGAEITGQGPDGSYEGNFTVKLGPTTASYRGSLRMDSLDEASRTATMHAKGTDKRGQGGANATIVSTMRQEGEETVVDVVTDFTITGRLARFGRGGMIEDISKRMMRDFSQCLQASMATEPAQAPAAAEAPAEAAPTAAAPVTPGEEADAAAASAGGAAAEASAATEAAPTPPAPTPAPPRAAPAPAKPIKGFSLLFSVLWDRIKRLFGRGEK